MAEQARQEPSKALRRKWILLGILGFVLFLIGVVACYTGARTGKPWIGPLVVGLVAGVRLAMGPARLATLEVLGVTTGMAFVAESTLVLCGVYTPADPTRWLLPAPLVPVWLLALWTNFGVRIGDYLPFMYGKWGRLLALSAVFGTLIFHNAERYEVLTMDLGVTSYLIVAALWAGLVPAMFLVGAHLFGMARQASASGDMNGARAPVG
ncbi:MAG: DUF2878 family protein [Armatimonadia bacterium]|nr:DUF2878 family protein [Armatimonadia bacterium]